MTDDRRERCPECYVCEEGPQTLTCAGCGRSYYYMFTDEPPAPQADPKAEDGLREKVWKFMLRHGVHMEMPANQRLASDIVALVRERERDLRNDLEAFTRAAHYWKDRHGQAEQRAERAVRALVSCFPVGPDTGNPAMDGSNPERMAEIIRADRDRLRAEMERWRKNWEDASNDLNDYAKRIEAICREMSP